jgi:tetratricopeptide (TPR) repeat protein
MLLSLVKRQRDALEKLDGLAATSKGAAAWATALRIRLTWDWRLLADPRGKSLVERLAHFRALAIRFDTDKSDTFLDDAPAEAVTDWRRLTFLEPPTVGDCGRFVPSSVDDELQEIRTAMATDAPALDETPAAAPILRSGERTQVRILDRGQWAAFGQRHLLSSLMAQDLCYHERWGQHDAGNEAAAEARERFGQLRLFPILAKRVSRERSGYLQALQASTQIVRARPDLVSAANWVCLLEKPIFAREGPPPAVPAEDTWFVPAIPFGTAFDHTNRIYGPHSSRRPPQEVSQALIALAPFEGGLRFAAVRQKYDNRPPFEAMREAMGPLVDYDVNSMYQLAKAAADRPDESLRLYTRVCETYDKYCVHLARLLVSQGKSDAAAAAYRRWVAGARDRVYVSNEVEWLVNYEYEHGRKQEAFRLARMAAEVYSSGGLQTLAKLLEKSGDAAGAEEYFRRASERYDQPGLLLEFYRRRVELFGEDRYKPALERMKQQIFPQGMTLAKIADFGAPPVDGVLVAGDNDALKQAGLALGDVIVALDGYRVRNFEQYQVVRSFTDSPQMALIAWHGGRYVEIRTSQKERRFGVDMRSYPSR